jgi:hypothetical protein
MKRSSVVLAMIAATAMLGCTVPQALGQPADPAASTPGPELDSYGRATVPQDGLVVVMGDDLAYGSDPRGNVPGANGSTVRRSSSAISEQLQRLFGSLQVENRGYPGDTLAEGIKRWQDAPAGDLLILTYGLGDATAKTPPDEFTNTLRNFIRSSRDHGAAVFVIVWPALKDPALNAALEPYRIAERTIAPDEGAAVIEAYKVAEKIKAPPSNRSYQQPELYSALAGTIATYVRVSDVARRPPAAEVARAPEGPRDFPTVLDLCRTAGNDYEALSRTHPIDPAQLSSVDQRLGQCRSGVLSYRARHPQAPFQCRVALESQALIFGEAMRDLAIASSRARRDASLTTQVRHLREQYAQTREAQQRNSEDLQRCP